MIVAVESNFVLELAFRQDEARECDDLLTLAAEGAITLAVPGCSLFEPYETLGRRTKHRDYIVRLVSDEFAQLSRTEGLAELRETSKAITHLLVDSGRVQSTALDSTIDKLSRVAAVIPLTAEVVRHALAIQVRAVAHPLTPTPSGSTCADERPLHLRVPMPHSADARARRRMPLLR